ncbi:MAG: dTDP-4-dehydrorhamnose reductase [Armatimonadetes bacterium]|jgi:dTDP-4-dehydrorhamnose reductase|nr:dTDP-4-dehydrorhamnose reductase [Armatimonadota bacterium]
MRIVVTGAAGMLGRDLVAILSEQHAVVPTDLAGAAHSLDITDAVAVRAFLEAERPDAVVHCAAYTDVDGCERDPDQAYRVNALGTAAVAGACHHVGAALVYLSTDFVFDGEKTTPYTEFDDPRPLGVYGASKLAGENLVRSLCPRHYVVRTQWLYGAHGKNFPFAILRRADAGEPLRVVADQVGVPTFTRDLCGAIARILEQPLYGTYHAANRGEVSWHGFATRLLALAGLDPSQVVPIPAAEWPSPTRRPAYSVLRPYVLELTGRADPLRPWEEALADFLARIGRIQCPDARG